MCACFHATMFFKFIFFSSSLLFFQLCKFKLGRRGVDEMLLRPLLVSCVCLRFAHSQGTCLNSTFAGLPFCNTALPIPERVADLIGRFSQLNLSTWAGLFSSWDGTFHVPALGIPGYEWWSEALHGLAHSPGVHFHGKTTFATMFPSPCTSGTSLNATLWHLTARAIATDARVFNNNGNAGLTYWSPDVNPFRDVRFCARPRGRLGSRPIP